MSFRLKKEYSRIKFGTLGEVTKTSPSSVIEKVIAANPENILYFEEIKMTDNGKKESSKKTSKKGSSSKNGNS
jgi:hypothetical protein